MDYASTIDMGNEEPSTMESKVEAALKKLKQHKAPGQDITSSEILQATGQMGIKVLYKTYDETWHTCQTTRREAR